MKNLTKTYVTIQTLIDKYAPRKIYSKNGFRFCICPLPEHSEITPSFLIKETSFHCFGCGKSGNAAEFVKDLYNISEAEAYKKIANDFEKKGA